MDGNNNTQKDTGQEYSKTHKFPQATDSMKLQVWSLHSKILKNQRQNNINAFREKKEKKSYFQKE